MASILENLQNIIDSKTAIKSSIANKGVTVPAEAKLNALPALIDSIEQGGGVSSGAPEIVDVVFANPVENAESTDIDVVVRIMSNGATANYGVQYRPVGTVNWIKAPTPVVTNNTDVKTLHGFDKIATTTLSGLLYQQSWDDNLKALRENNNRYEVRAYITGTTNNYVTPRIYTTGWSKYFDNIYEATNDLELGGTKKKRAIAVIHSTNLSTTLSQLGGDYFKTSDGYLGVSKTHVFNEAQDIPIYFEDGINIKYYVRWVILYTNVATSNITINDVTEKNYLYCYFGNCTPSLAFGESGNANPSRVDGIRFSPITNVSSIGNDTFNNCHSLTSIIIPDSVTSIGDFAFQGCNSLVSITISNSVVSIGNNAFSGCRSLTSIIIPNSVTSIGYRAFEYCSVTSITISNSVASIGDSAFYYCTSLVSITISNSVVSIGNNAFYNCHSLTSIIIPNSVTWISDNVFRNCYSLTSITISNSVASIGNNAFSSCYSLTSITIPNSVTRIYSYAFENCYSLASIIIPPNSVSRIDNDAFRYCYSLTSITIPSTVTYIGSNVFDSCYSLTSIIIPLFVESMGGLTFNECHSLTSITFLSTPITSFPTTSIIRNTRKVYNVTLPSGWFKTINLMASSVTTADCVLTHRCMLDIFNKLSSYTTGTLTLGATNLARMSAAEISIATNKGWTVN